MIDETFTDAERRRLMGLVINSIPFAHGDPELSAILSKLSGTDTVVIARRAYPSAYARARALENEVPDE